MVQAKCSAVMGLMAILKYPGSNGSVWRSGNYADPCRPMPTHADADMPR